MKNIKVLLLLTLSTFNFVLLAQSAPIAIDGFFDDWTSNLTTYTDTNETIDGVDLLEFQVTNDENYLYIRIKADREFDLTEGSPILHNFFIYLDTDNNSETGFKVRDDYGAELGIEFANRIVYNNFTGTSDPQVRFADIEFRSAPTVTSDEFEIAIGRNSIPDGTNALFPSSNVKILLRNRENFDWLPNLNNVFTYTFDETPVAPYTPVDFNKTDDSFIRIVAYNTKLNSLLDNSKLDEYERIMKAVQPDIVGFVESYDTSTSYIKSLFDDWLPLGTTDGWHVRKHGGEVTVSRWEIIQEWDLTRQFPVLIDLPDSYGTDLLYTNAHLNCCGADDARQDQADQYAAFILDAKNEDGIITLPENTAIVYSGDLNLVGLSQQLTTLLTGDIQDTFSYGAGGPLDWDNTDLKEENALQSEKRMSYTWRSDNSSFPPGKLDFMIFSDYVLTSEKSFVIQTEIMPTDRLNLYGLQQFDTSIASDHFPVVTDFSVNRTLSNPDVVLLENSAFPNPTFGDLNLQFKEFNNYSITIFNSVGISVLSTKISSSKVRLNIDSFASGLYHVRIQNDQGENQVIKVIKK
ncbi:T9SS type A sorting domain-containing protein [Tenacibaculum sp. MEBiC06402]|uniref:T9SS type A sorting domain-containing protein n=1 Tax=unclassified Tenacibaculum TaxID=2635139 RepID=UPI003B9D6928